MGSGVLVIFLIGGILLVASSPTLQLKIAGFFARKQGEQIQRNLTGGKLFDEAGADVQRGIAGGQTFAEVGTTFGESIQKGLFGGLLIK